MPRRLQRPLLIALLACLQLVLQPLAASAGCALWGGGGEGCCCAAEEPGEPAAPSCCASESAPRDEAPAPRPGTPETPGPCGCVSAPAQPPATEPQLPDGPQDPFTLAALPALELPPVPLDARVCAPAVGSTRDPGGGPPRFVLLQVFRL